MGVYIIKSKFTNWYKIGYSKNVYNRCVAGQFNYCKYPDELKGRLGFKDLSIVFWYNNLNLAVEGAIHKVLRGVYRNCGEWYYNINLSDVEELIRVQFGGLISKLNDEDRKEAMHCCMYWKQRLIPRKYLFKECEVI